MTTADRLQDRLRALIAPDFGARLFDRGVARSLIWRDGVLPEGAPQFQDSLTDELLNYGYSCLSIALRLYGLSASPPRELRDGLLRAGETIEAAVLRGDPELPSRGIDRLSSATAFHLARYGARAYSVLETPGDKLNLAPIEHALVHLIRRQIHELMALIREDIVRVPASTEDADAAAAALTTAMFRALAAFHWGVTTGSSATVEVARTLLRDGKRFASELGAVTQWWGFALAEHLIDDIWTHCLHAVVPQAPQDDAWNGVRLRYIHRLRISEKPVWDLWPSQMEAAKRILDDTDNLVIALPTSAGKTRIAELAILRCLSQRKRVIYVTPLRALSAQIEQDLAEIFRPLGFQVASLYGSAPVEGPDAEMLRKRDIAVTTPEKLDFALRISSDILDDVGLLVLDEGHMLGVNEREVRYEALVQRLLRRRDAASRRIVCLSALFPEKDALSEFVGWLRRDVPGDAIHLAWRPTRLRSGLLLWEGDGARLTLEAREGKSPFVPRFVATRPPPEGSRRRNPFPATKNELTLAAAWEFAARDKAVLIYSPQRKSVEKLAKEAIRCVKQGLLSPILASNADVAAAQSVGQEWLGHDHPAVAALSFGIAVHHGGLPRVFLNEVERIIKARACPVVVASPTLAQGLNISASVLLIPSIRRGRDLIPPAEFINVVGRAGRAYVDLEGLVIHVVFEKKKGKERSQIGQWRKLKRLAKASELRSGILHLSYRLLEMLQASAGAAGQDVIAYITGVSNTWSPAPLGAPRPDTASWTEDLASLDAALLALVDADAAYSSLPDALSESLAMSLFAKNLASTDQAVQKAVMAFLNARVAHIWKQTTPAQRRGFHLAGLGLSPGRLLGSRVDDLTRLILQMESAIEAADTASAVDAATEAAEILFAMPLFAPKRLDRTLHWKPALGDWIAGTPLAQLLEKHGVEVDIIQDGFTYRLPWGLEVARVHAQATKVAGADDISGAAAMCVEVGSCNIIAARLLRARLSSREAATFVAANHGAKISTYTNIDAWLQTSDAFLLLDRDVWPSTSSFKSWKSFVSSRTSKAEHKWGYQSQKVMVDWDGEAPMHGTEVRTLNSGGEELICTIDLQRLGRTDDTIRFDTSHLIAGTVEADGAVILEFFG